MRALLVILSLFCLPLHSQVTDSLKYTVLSPSEFLQKYKSTPDALLIDVRNSKDFDKSRIRGAINLPFPIRDEYFKSVAVLSPDKSLFIYCYAGVWSKKSALAFYQKGFRNIYSLEGGFGKWKLKKMPVERKRVRKAV